MAGAEPIAAEAGGAAAPAEDRVVDALVALDEGAEMAAAEPERQHFSVEQLPAGSAVASVPDLLQRMVTSALNGEVCPRRVLAVAPGRKHSRRYCCRRCMILLGHQSIRMKPYRSATPCMPVPVGCQAWVDCSFLASASS